MKVIKCPSCGAKVKPDSNICEYCGSTFDVNEIETISNIKKSKPKLSCDELIKVIETSNNFNIKSTLIAKLPIIVFALIWCSVTIFMGLSSLKYLRRIFSVIPFLFTVFGVCIFVPIIISNGGRGHIKKIVSLLKENKINDAFNYAKQNTYKNDYVLAVSVLIAFYLCDDLNYAYSNIKRLNALTITSYSKTTSALIDIFNYFEINTKSN